MAILNNNTVTIDAVLTAKGRELLARNDGSFIHSRNDGSFSQSRNDSSFVHSRNNGSFVNSKTFDGFRKVIQDEFQYAYIIDLGGNIRELSGKDGIFLNEKHTIFGQAAAVGIAIMFLIKDQPPKSKNKKRGPKSPLFLFGMLVAVTDSWRI
jgi:hypothetical protein